MFDFTTHRKKVTARAHHALALAPQHEAATHTCSNSESAFNFLRLAVIDKTANFRLT